MYHVSFPGFGIDVDIVKQFDVFGIPIYWYGIIIATGLMLAVIYGSLNAKRLGISADKLLNCVIVGVITGIIGARLYFVLFQWDYYSVHPDKILAINEGGLAIYGGIIGALAGGLIVGRKEKMNIPALLDVAAVGFLIGQGIGRWGNFFNQEAYGVATDLPWRMVSEGTNGIAVHPCFLYESVWCLLGALLLHIFSYTKMRKYHGQMALIYMVWYGLERTFVEGLRTDSLYIPNTDFRVSQLLSAVIAITGLVMLIMLYKKKYEKLVPYEDEIKLAKFKKPVYSSSSGDDDFNSNEISSHSVKIELDEVNQELSDKTASDESQTEKTVEKPKASSTRREPVEPLEDNDTQEEASADEDGEDMLDINDVIGSKAENDEQIDKILNDVKKYKK